MEKKVLTQEEITQLKSTREKRFQLVESFGILESRIQEINLHKNKVNKLLLSIRGIAFRFGHYITS